MKIFRVATLTVVMAGAALAGCSDIYYDRRETIASGAADAVASNLAVQTVDPWPPNVANQNIPMDGARAALAIDRYRTGRVISPSGAGTSSAGYQQQPTQQPAASGGASTSTAAGTQVK
jgi:type IV pilus biogenesis protein CpaD/CtpE